MPTLSAAQTLPAITQTATVSVGVNVSAVQTLAQATQAPMVLVDREERLVSAAQVLAPTTQAVRIRLGGGFMQAELRVERAQAQPRVEPVPATGRP